MGGYTRAVSGQRLGRNVSAKQTLEQCLFLDSRFLIMQLLDYSNGRAVFSTWCVIRCYEEGTRSVDSSIWESVNRGLDPVAEK
jgi:hypothetical protein